MNNPGMRSCGIPRVHKKSRNLFIPLRHKPAINIQITH